MQKLVNLREEERLNVLIPDITAVKNERLDRMKSRRDVYAGINDFPNVEEKLQVQLKSPILFRPARILEELRLKIQSLNLKPRVQIL